MYVGRIVHTCVRVHAWVMRTLCARTSTSACVRAHVRVFGRCSTRPSCSTAGASTAPTRASTPISQHCPSAPPRPVRFADKRGVFYTYKCTYFCVCILYVYLYVLFCTYCTYSVLYVYVRIIRTRYVHHCTYKTYSYVSLYVYTYKIHMNMYRSEYIRYCIYLCVLSYVQDNDTIAHRVRTCMYLCTYIRTKHICTRTGLGFHICTYMYEYTYKIHTPLLIKYDNFLPSLKEKDERRSFQCRSPAQP